MMLTMMMLNEVDGIVYLRISSRLRVKWFVAVATHKPYTLTVKVQFCYCVFFSSPMAFHSFAIERA